MHGITKQCNIVIHILANDLINKSHKNKCFVFIDN